MVQYLDRHGLICLLGAALTAALGVEIGAAQAQGSAVPDDAKTMATQQAKTVNDAIPVDLPAWIRSPKAIEDSVPLANVVPPLHDEDDPRSLNADNPPDPVADVPFTEQLRHTTGEAGQPPEPARTPRAETTDGVAWKGGGDGLYRRPAGGGAWERHGRYGVNGPLATHITALVVDSRGVLWTGTPLGLSARGPNGNWRHIQGREGLPVEHITALAIDREDRLWIGTPKGAIQYRPYEEGRQWFYRAGGRYLPGNHVEAITVEDNTGIVHVATDAGPGAIGTVTHTLEAKAHTIENRINRFHRRLGLVVEAVLDDPFDPEVAYTLDDANDGLWTSWHVAAMSLAYAVTGDEAHRHSAQESMHAMYWLQNAPERPGLPARTIVPAEIGAPRRAARQDADDIHTREQWRPAEQDRYYWRTDTSNDEVDGHFLALYCYWRHIAQHNAEELAHIRRQTRALIDHIIRNDYHLHDWDGKPTKWGFWHPDALNDDPTHYLESGLGSLQLLSFLKTAYAITGDSAYQRHYEKLIVEHGYLSNVLLEKKVFPDSNNHSDDQLAYVAWYPLIQLEWDPEIRRTLRKSVRRHYKIIEPKRSSFFYFVSATVDPGYVKLETAVQNLRNIPTDRRMWKVTNSHRTDVRFAARPNRFGRPVLDRVLPADERSWDKWNQDPYEPDGGGPGSASPSGTTDPDVPTPKHIAYPDGAYEDDGAAWLMAYWLGRYHGFIAAPAH